MSNGFAACEILLKRLARSLTQGASPLILREMESVFFKRKDFGRGRVRVSYLATELSFQASVLGKAKGRLIEEIFVLDTGAGFTVLRGSVLAVHGVSYDDLVKPVNGTTIGGYGWKSKPYVLDICFPDVDLKMLNVYVDPCHDAQEPEFSLLGWDFIDRFRFCFRPDLSVELKPWCPESVY